MGKGKDKRNKGDSPIESQGSEGGSLLPNLTPDLTNSLGLK